MRQCVINVLGLTVAWLPDRVEYVRNGDRFPEFRGKREFPCGMRPACVELKEQGCQFACGVVDWANLTSIAARCKFGVKHQAARISKLPLPIHESRRIVFGASGADACGTRDQRQ